jgi:hypothetical protein
MSKSVSCSNPWCSPRELCVHCKPNTATTAPITHDQPKRLQDEPEPGRVVQSDPSGSMSLLGNLLAVIHGDGGHRQVEIGSEQAAREAEEIVTQMRVKAEAITADARADAFDDAAAIVRIQHRHGGLNLTTPDACMAASYVFSNQAYMIREKHGFPHPDDAAFHAQTQARLLETLMPNGASVTLDGHVKMPTSEAEALVMVAVGEAFLKGRAEERARMENRS